MFQQKHIIAGIVGGIVIMLVIAVTIILVMQSTTRSLIDVLDQLGR